MRLRYLLPFAFACGVAAPRSESPAPPAESGADPVAVEVRVHRVPPIEGPARHAGGEHWLLGGVRAVVRGTDARIADEILEEPILAAAQVGGAWLFMTGRRVLRASTFLGELREHGVASTELRPFGSGEGAMLAIGNDLRIHIATAETALQPVPFFGERGVVDVTAYQRRDGTWLLREWGGDAYSSRDGRQWSAATWVDPMQELAREGLTDLERRSRSSRRDRDSALAKAAILKPLLRAHPIFRAGRSRVGDAYPVWSPDGLWLVRDDDEQLIEESCHRRSYSDELVRCGARRFLPTESGELLEVDGRPWIFSADDETALQYQDEITWYDRRTGEVLGSELELESDAYVDFVGMHGGIVVTAQDRIRERTRELRIYEIGTGDTVGVFPLSSERGRSGVASDGTIWRAWEPRAEDGTVGPMRGAVFGRRERPLEVPDQLVDMALWTEALGVALANDGVHVFRDAEWTRVGDVVDSGARSRARCSRSGCVAGGWALFEGPPPPPTIASPDPLARVRELICPHGVGERRPGRVRFESRGGRAIMHVEDGERRVSGPTDFDPDDVSDSSGQVLASGDDRSLVQVCTTECTLFVAGASVVRVGEVPRHMRMATATSSGFLVVAGVRELFVGFISPDGGLRTLDLLSEPVGWVETEVGPAVLMPRWIRVSGGPAQPASAELVWIAPSGERGTVDLSFGSTPRACGDEQGRVVHLHGVFLGTARVRVSDEGACIESIEASGDGGVRTFRAREGRLMSSDGAECTLR